MTIMQKDDVKDPYSPAFALCENDAEARFYTELLRLKRAGKLASESFRNFVSDTGKQWSLR